jgi:aspartate kinase
MKVCNLGTVIHLEDIMQMSDYICTEAPLLIIVPAFDQIKRSLQEISIHLFRAEQEKASQAILHLEKHCMETVSGFLTDHGSAFEFAQTQITSNFQHIRQLANSTFSQSDERRLLISGEYISSALVAAYLKSRHIDATVADAATLMHLDADGKPDLETICQQAQAFAQTAQAAVYVTQSLVCQNAYGEVEYIAKGDSCAYAMYLAIAFRAQELVQRIQAKEIYIPNDNQKPEESNDTMFSFEEAESLINAGVRLVSSRSLSLAHQYQISIRLINGQGRIIRLVSEIQEETHTVKAITARKHITYIRLHSSGSISSFRFLEKTLTVFAKYKVSIYLMTSSSTNISMAIETDTETLSLLRRELSGFAELITENNIATISIFGKLNWGDSDASSRIIELLHDIPILMISYGNDNHCVSIAIRQSDCKHALCTLSDHFLGTDFTHENGSHSFSEEYNAFII